MLPARIRRLIVLLAIVTLPALIPTSSAQALSANPASSTLSQAFGCVTANCLPFQAFTLSGSPSVTGTFDIVGGTTLNFSIDLTSATLPGSDGPVTAVVFTNVNYSGSFSVTDEGSNMYSFLDQMAHVTGTLTPSGAGVPVVFDIDPVNTTGSCSGTPGISLVCGLQFGAGTGFAIDVNGNTRYFRHSIDVFSLIPEPGTATLFGLGLALLSTRRRRDGSTPVA